MMFIKVICLYICILFIKFSISISSNTLIHSENEFLNQTDQDQYSVKSILQFLYNQSAQLNLGTQKNIVLLLGITGSGKTTTGLLLTENDLISYEIEGTGEFVITDEKNRISRDSAITSKTIIPEKMIDENSGTVYFDCPGFSDTRGLLNDLSVVYFIKKLFNFADSIKLVFMIASSSVRISGDRREFMELAKYAITMIKDIEKYHNGIALIVTKVPNESNRSDEIFVNRTLYFLNHTKNDLIKKNEDSITSQNEKEINLNVIKFIDIFLEKTDANSKKIGIFRQTSENGPVKDMPVIQNEKEIISTIINRNIQFIRKENNDFRYTISTDSLNQIHSLMVKTQQALSDDLIKINDDLMEVYLKKEKNILDLNNLYKTMSVGYQILSETHTLAPKLFEAAILNITKSLDVDISTRFIDHTNLIAFFMSISGLNQSDHTNDELKNIIQFLDESKLNT